MPKAHKHPTSIVVLLLIVLLVSPGTCNASVGISFDILSVGPFSLGVDIPWRIALPLDGLLLVGKVVFSFFSPHEEGYATYRYEASHQAGAPVTRMLWSTFSINPQDHLRGEPIRMKYYDLVREGRIALP